MRQSKMIKVYCDRCGKEIIGRAFKVMEEVEAVDGLGHILVKFPKETHICDECQYKELTCGFKIGDQVITDDGRVGSIIDICTCDTCKERGFYEPEVQYHNGETDYIMISAKNNGFKNFYKIGDQIFGNLDEERLVLRIATRREELEELEAQLAVVNKLKNNQLYLNNYGYKSGLIYQI